MSHLIFPKGSSKEIVGTISDLKRSEEEDISKAVLSTVFTLEGAIMPVNLKSTFG